MKQYQVNRVFAEKLSGKNVNRPELKNMLDYIREGIDIAKSQGKYKGRQPIPIDWGKFRQLYER